MAPNLMCLQALPLQRDPRQLFAIGFGSALAPMLDAIERAGAATRVVALEPDPAVARLMLARRDWTRWFAEGRLCVLAGPDYLGASDCARHVDVSEPPVVFTSPQLTSDRSSDAAAAQAVVARIISESEANAAARKRFAGSALYTATGDLVAHSRSTWIVNVTERDPAPEA